MEARSSLQNVVLRGARHGLAPAFMVLACIGAMRAVPLVGQSDWALRIAAGTHALTVPWYLAPVSYRFNPAVEVGADRVLRDGERWKLSLGINVGFVRDHWWMTGLSLAPELRIARAIPGGFLADAGVGLGYMHYFWRRKTLELEDGRYVETTDWGRPSLILPLSLTVAYQGDRDHPLSVAPFVSAQWGVQALFLSEAPVMTHLSLLGGVRIRRGNGKGGRR